MQATTLSVHSSLQRWRWRIRGQIQGVGFRPFVYRLARCLPLTGWVRNDAEGVLIEAQGTAADLRRFESRLLREHPPRARVTSIRRQLGPAALVEESGFRIAVSPAAKGGRSSADVTVDLACCPACLAEVQTAGERRYRYPLTNCTDCGPRYSIVSAAPYDRSRTTMSAFAMCGFCQQQYGDPLDRRFHAQPIACPDCGPAVQLWTARGRVSPGDPLVAAAAWINQGGIVGVKGLGGFHLAARADDAAAVRRLRLAKRRDSKPFAVMVRSLATADRYVRLSEAGRRWLTDPAAPIVLASLRGDSGGSPTAEVLREVAPGVHRWGVMLPYTPLHFLLMEQLDCDALVLTSGNLSDEPLVFEDQQAVAELGPLCDAILLHNRRIQRSVDDSVIQDRRGVAPLVVRRSRGLAPAPLPLPTHLPPAVGQGLCVGAELKSTLAVVRGGDVILSQHLGDLKHAATWRRFSETANDLLRLFDVSPRWVAHDLHPGYLSTRFAREFAAARGLPLIPVQHHHAHAAAVAAEHGRTGRVLAFVADGAGYGDQGGVWGGEFLLSDLAGYRRLGALEPLPLIGGDQAAVDLRRCGLALLRNAFPCSWQTRPEAARLVPDEEQRRWWMLALERGVQCPETSSLGRVFDGVAALLGVARENRHEAEAAQRLESLAWRHVDSLATPEPFPAGDDGDGDPRRGEDQAPFQVGVSDLVRKLLELKLAGASLEFLADWFHRRLAGRLAATIAAACREQGVAQATLSGGVFCNERLTTLMVRRLQQRGLEVLTAQAVPPNDGGVAYGQAVVAAARLAGGND